MTYQYDAKAFQGEQDCGTSDTGAARSMVWLRGQPHLEDYLSFYRKKVIGGDKADPRMLATRWREANDLYYQLEQDEAGIADSISCKPLDKRLAGLAATLEDHAWFRSSFDILPYSIELVELDKLVVSQIQVENGFSHAIAKRLGAKPTPAQLFRFCLPIERDLAPVKIQRLSANRYQFSSPSSDFRAHDTILLHDPDLAGVTLPGPAAAMLGISVGFGSNFLSAVRSESRVVLQNGYHRAYALRSAGLTHAWCVVEHVTRKDELRLSATEELLSDPAFYLAAKRPPILRDFFDPRIAEQVLTKPVECLVEVEITVRSTTVTPD
ncbi:hypothetical protein [Novosphingobium sp.]|uniref:hypothetical protein n=1 Tax=Novosphingobium sp. TaxID=1874826 RepID=UPI0025E7129B|nr:hypothetical protein [Novosphingobium sp.]